MAHDAGALEPPTTPDEEARIEASVADVRAAGDRLLALDLEDWEPATRFEPGWQERER